MRNEPFLERYPFLQPLLMAAVVLATLGYSTLVGSLIAGGEAALGLLLVAGPAGVLALGIALRYPHFLVLILPLTALFLPTLELPTGTATMLPLSLLITSGLCGLWLARALLRNTTLLPSPLNRPLLIFSAVCVLSLGWGIAWRDPILRNWPNFIVTQVASLVSILMSMGAALLVGNYITREGQLKFIFGAFIVGGTLMTVTQFLTIDQRVLNDRGLWGLWTAAPIFGLVIMQPGLRWRWRAALLALLAFNLYQTMVVNSLWLSGWLPTLVALIALFFLRSPKLFFTLLPFGVVGAVLSYGFFLLVAQSNVDEGGLERLIIWQQNWRVVKDHWLFGVGPAGYAIYYMTYFPSEARSTHNNYLDIVAQFGIVGLGLWFWIAWAGAREGWRLTRELAPGFRRTLAATATAGWVASLAAMMLGDWLLPFAYNQGVAGYKYTVYSWIFLGTLITLRHLQPAEDGPRLEPQPARAPGQTREP